MNLKRLFLAQETHRAEHGAYASIDEIGFSPESVRDDHAFRYAYTLESVQPDRLFAQATADRHLPVAAPICFDARDMVGDAWRVDERGLVKVSLDICNDSKRMGPMIVSVMFMSLLLLASCENV